MKYISALYSGNPAAFWFLAGMACLGIAAYLQPLTDKKFDEEMEAWDADLYLSEQEEIAMLERMMSR